MKTVARRRLKRLEQAAALASGEPLSAYSDAERRHSLACFYAAVIQQCGTLPDWGDAEEWNRRAVDCLGQDWEQDAGTLSPGDALAGMLQ